MGEPGLFQIAMSDCSLSARWDKATRELALEPGGRCSCTEALTQPPGPVSGTPRLPSKGVLELELTSDNELGMTCTWRFNGKLI